MAFAFCPALFALSRDVMRSLTSSETSHLDIQRIQNPDRYLRPLPDLKQPNLSISTLLRQSHKRFTYTQSTSISNPKETPTRSLTDYLRAGLHALRTSTSISHTNIEFSIHINQLHWSSISFSYFLSRLLLFKCI